MLNLHQFYKSSVLKDLQFALQMFIDVYNIFCKSNICINNIIFLQHKEQQDIYISHLIQAIKVFHMDFWQLW